MTDCDCGVVNIKPDIYPMAYPRIATIGICDTGDINDVEELCLFVHILTHEYLHVLLYHLEGDEANIGLDTIDL